MVDASFAARPAAGDGVGMLTPIKHAVAGVKYASRIEDCGEAIVRHFSAHRVDRKPVVHHIGPDSPTLRTIHRLAHAAPIAAGTVLAHVTKSEKRKKSLTRLASKIELLNTAFPHFTQNTFDFVTSSPIDLPGFSSKAYLDVVCAGVHRHLFRKDETQVTLGGREHKAHQGDFLKAALAEQGTLLMRTAALVLSKGFARGAGLIDFNRASFEAALAQVPEGNLHVLAPSHRSYIDFLIAAYLCYAAPELGIKLPHIAAAEEFSKIFILGKLLQRMQAFYIKRHVGRADPELDRNIRQLIARGETLMFFVEGERSRTRRFLHPKRGLLRSLQSTGAPCTLLPISISYDRVSEERSFVEQLRGGEKPRMRFRTLLGWTQRLVRGEIDMGRIHLRCGDPVHLHKDSDPHAVSRTIMAELQRGMAVSTHHLDAFVRSSGASPAGVTTPWLAAEIAARGGVVVEGKLRRPESVSRIVERTMRFHWMHLFYDEAAPLFATHPAYDAHVGMNDFRIAPPPKRAAPATEDQRAKLRGVLVALFTPVLRDYERVLESIAGMTPVELASVDAGGLVRRQSRSFLPDVEVALHDLVEREILAPQGKGFAHGAKWSALEALRRECRAFTVEPVPSNVPLDEVPRAALEASAPV